MPAIIRQMSRSRRPSMPLTSNPLAISQMMPSTDRITMRTANMATSIIGHLAESYLLPHHFVEHEQAEQQGNVHDGRVHQPLGAKIRPRARSPQANLHQQNANHQSTEKVPKPRESRNRRKQADGQKRGRREDNLAEGRGAVPIRHGKHADSRAGIVLTIHPGDGVKMRELPQKQNREEQPSASVQRAPGRGPSDEQWYRSRNRADGR